MSPELLLLPDRADFPTFLCFRRRRRRPSERWLPTAGDPLQFGRIRVLMALTAIPGVFEYRMGADTGTAFQSRTEHSTEL